MERLLIWSGLDEWRAETSHVRIDDDRLMATGTQLGVTPEPYRLDYALRTGPRFVTETLDLSVLRDGVLKRARVVRDQEGRWTVDDRPRPDLDGAIDTDLMASPLFNTMPVLRDEMLSGGEPRELVMAFVAVPDLAVTRSDQRYTPLGDGRVNYRSGDFTADIEYDADGLVLNYPGLAERVET